MSGNIRVYNDYAQAVGKVRVVATGETGRRKDRAIKRNECGVEAEGRRQTAAGTIRSSARELFVRRGFHETSVEHIARRAGVSKPLVYHYFPDKRRLFAEVYAEMWHAAVAGQESSLEGRSVAPAEAVVSLIRRARRCEGLPALARVSAWALGPVALEIESAASVPVLYRAGLVPHVHSGGGGAPVRVLVHLIHDEVADGGGVGGERVLELMVEALRRDA